MAQDLGPQKLEVVRGNKRLKAWTRDQYEVKRIEPFEQGARLVLSKLRGQVSSASTLVVFTRYAKHLDNEEFNASRGGTDKIKLRVLQRKGNGSAASFIACSDGCPGWGWFNDTEIQRCDECGRFATDSDAAVYVRELATRSYPRDYPVSLMRSALRATRVTLSHNDIAAIALFAESLVRSDEP